MTTRSGRPWGTGAVLALGLLAGCTPPRVWTPAGIEMIPPPVPSQVEHVLFLFGDPGEAAMTESPVLARLRDDIEWWSQNLPRDSAIVLLVLGDIVYPLGLNPPGSSSYDSDTATVMSQIRTISGPWATQHKARAYFMAGNHDWGLREDWEAYVRLKNLDDFLIQTRAQTGALVELVPTAGTGGPFVLDLNDNFRLLVLDSAWWLLARDPRDRAAVLDLVEEAFASAGGRQILIAAHHPFRSGGPHGGGFSVWDALGLRYVLCRSGAVLQDISSLPYRELEQGLRRIFARHGAPVAFIGGHEHSLQVIEGAEPTDPPFNLVSGSGSKLSDVGETTGLAFAQSAPGYMRLFLERSGGVTLYVEAGPPDYLSCPGAEPRRSACMAEGIAAFQTVYSRRLR